MRPFVSESFGTDAPSDPVKLALNSALSCLLHPLERDQALAAPGGKVDAYRAAAARPAESERQIVVAAGRVREQNPLLLVAVRREREFATL